MNNAQKFQAELTAQYTRLFATTEYAMVAARYTPESLAEKMTSGLIKGIANKEGRGIENTCKTLGIKYTYKAIAAFLS